jgi:hypothetical protein
MIDVALTKENALPYDLWGLLSESWKPAPQDGVTVFLQGLEKRGPDNRRKRIYMSAVTPDLYQWMYQGKIVGFWDELLAAGNAIAAAPYALDAARRAAIPAAGTRSRPSPWISCACFPSPDHLVPASLLPLRLMCGGWLQG